MDIAKAREIASQQTGDVASALEYILRLVESQDLQLHGCSKDISEHDGMTLEELLTYYSEHSINWNDIFLEITVFSNGEDEIVKQCCFSVASTAIELEQAMPEDWERAKYTPCAVPDNIIEYISLARDNADSCKCSLDMTLSDSRLLAFNVPSETDVFMIVLQLSA